MNTKKKENFSNIFDDIPQGMTELGRAEKIQKIVSALGFDWSLPEETLHKIQEEYEETKQSILNKESKEKITEEIGDLFFAASHTIERPDRIFKGAVRKLFVFLLPFSLMASYPAKILIEEGQNTAILTIFGVTIFMFSLVFFIWKMGLRGYSSASS